uniref:Proliferating cell nuclear antigen n=1 Tax=Marseillevirus LCMAC102 TaxID=2506603 RepID=A0A481YUF2_9VIRU|nr:MAG: proliferating cell nuclear antigen [Marseillevirus LCMAC102]
MANTTNDKVFYAEASKGYTFKVMIDSLAVAMPRTSFRIEKKGFYHRATDQSSHILFDVNFARENFRPYVCHEEIVFSLNLKHLQKMVRNVKKKDSIILFINTKDPDKLGLAIRPSGSTSGHNSRLETVFITITRNNQPERLLALPETFTNENGDDVKVYGHAMVIDATDFQKIKKMTTVGKTVSVEMQKGNYISFYSDNGQLYSSKLEFGEIQENPESESEEEEDSENEIKGWYAADFHMSIFILLMKLPGLCSQMQFYSPKVERYPLKIKMHAGNLGSITVYIKDTTQIAFEDTQRRQCQTTEDLSKKI